MPHLADQFCPNIHDAAITAAAYDPASGTVASADASGLVAVQRRGETSPGLRFRPGGPVQGGLGLVQGGAYVAVGDLEGGIGVYRTDDGSPVFQELREGERGRVRAMHGVAVSPEGTRCAAIAADGLVRMWDLVRNHREVAWSGFGGATVEFDPRGERLLCLDTEGQIRLVDLMSRSGMPVDRLRTPAERACFTHDGTHVLAVGRASVSLLRVVDGRMVASFATRGGSGLLNLMLSPEGDRAAVVTHRSVHVFSLPELQPVDSFQHGAPDTSGAAHWTPAGIRVGGVDGLFHHGGKSSPGAVTAVAGQDKFRAVAHGHHVAFWAQARRAWLTDIGTAVRDIAVDRDGRLIAVVPHEGPVRIIDTRQAQVVFDGGPETAGALKLEVGGPVVAVRLATGGLRWWHLAKNQAFDLSWPQGMTLSGSGMWLAVITPRGVVHVLDPATGLDAMPAPRPLAEVPIVDVAFVNRRADMLVLDRDGVLGHYDLAAGLRDGQPAEGRDLVDFDVPIDRIWGITTGPRCAVRMPDGDHCAIAMVDIATGEVCDYQADLPAGSTVCEQTGQILAPARACAVLELAPNGHELRVLRSLADDQWMSFSATGILEASDRASEVL
ncbi:MAG: WD40 repeat domain-containing protein [Pseudomonadota bacterium]